MMLWHTNLNHNDEEGGNTPGHVKMVFDGKEGSPLIFVSKKGVQRDEEGQEETLLVASEWLQKLYVVSY